MCTYYIYRTYNSIHGNVCAKCIILLSFEGCYSGTNGSKIIFQFPIVTFLTSLRTLRDIRSLYIESWDQFLRANYSTDYHDFPFYPVGFRIATIGMRRDIFYSTTFRPNLWHRSPKLLTRLYQVPQLRMRGATAHPSIRPYVWMTGYKLMKQIYIEYITLQPVQK